ncbi:MAG TPA: PDZ domain-containing protein [Candidatus Acidoferrales bacterium]|nr:PDZ domain-containing protein [Candidatus Acidoferrales bacterium]
MLALLLAAASPAAAEIRYSVSLARRAEHQFAVTMIVPDVRSRLVVAMPAWNATYQIRDFAERVEDFRASQADAAGQALPVRSLDDQTWEIDASGAVRVQYSVYWNEPGPFSSQLNGRHAFLNLAEVLFYAPARRREAAQLAFTDLPDGWKIAVELPPGPCPTCFAAAGYDALVDAPVEIGSFAEFQFEANSAHCRVAVDGSGWDRAALESWLRKIVGYETTLMREAPFPEYLFIYHIGPGSGGGGMEHANSTAIAVPNAARIPSVTAHEFFHLWNVKRIRPQTLEPVDYSRPMWTRALWFAEGVTSTYGSYTLVRAGLWTPDRYFQHLSDLITGLEDRPAGRWQSVEESSLDTWLDKYPFYNRPDRSISYYDKGELDGLLLDILIRDQTGNRASLDDVLRYMNAAYAHRGRFYDDSAGIEAAVERVAGRSFAEFFRRYVAGAGEVPWKQLLARGGLDVSTRLVQVADPGIEWRVAPSGGAEVTEVTPGGAAEKAGLVEGDRIVSAGRQPLPRNPQAWADERQPGETIELRVERGGQAVSLPLTLGARLRTLYSVEPLPNPPAAARRILDGILHGEP